MVVMVVVVVIEKEESAFNLIARQFPFPSLLSLTAHLNELSMCLLIISITCTRIRQMECVCAVVSCAVGDRLLPTTIANSCISFGVLVLVSWAELLCPTTITTTLLTASAASSSAAFLSSALCSRLMACKCGA